MLKILIGANNIVVDRKKKFSKSLLYCRKEKSTSDFVPVGIVFHSEKIVPTLCLERAN